MKKVQMFAQHYLSGLCYLYFLEVGHSALPPP